jgi:UDP-glucose 4-epimerase
VEDGVTFEKVLVTGGAGRLGRYVVKELAGHCRVSVLDRPGASPPAANLSADVHDRTERPAAPIGLSVDVLDLDALSVAMQGHDAVVHLAAIDSSVTAAPEAVFDANVRGTWNALHAADRAGVGKVVICSSVSATGIDYTNPQLPPLYLPVDEAHPLRPSQAYGLSKQLDELIGRSFGSRGRMEVTCLRPSWVLFPEAARRVIGHRRGAVPPDPSSNPVAPSGRHREPLPLLRSYVSPEDAARAFRLALELRGAPYDVFLITARDTFETEPTLAHLERTYGRLPEVRKPEVYEANPHASAFDISRAREILGWSPSSGWNEFAARFDKGAEDSQP